MLSRVLRYGWLVLLTGVVTCGGQNSRQTESSAGTGASAGRAGNGSGASKAGSGCPDGYPYCATLDACLLPGRECPSGDPPAGGSDAGEDAAQGGAIGDVPVQPGGGLSSTLEEPTPGQIRCGNGLCDSFDEYCCSGMGGSGNGSGFETCS